MKKIVFVLLMLLTFNVYADTCKSDELKRLKNIAEQVELSYEYKVSTIPYSDGQDVSFAEYAVVVSNLNKEIKVNWEEDFYAGVFEEFKNDGTNTGRLSGYKDGENAVVVIRAYTNDACSGEILAKKSIKLPYLNPFYYQDICKTYSDFKYCQQIVDKSLTVDKFKSELNNYLKTNESNEKEDVNNNSNNSYYLIIIIAVIIVIFVLLISVIIKKRRKNQI